MIFLEQIGVDEFELAAAAGKQKENLGSERNYHHEKRRIACIAAHAIACKHSGPYRQLPSIESASSPGTACAESYENNSDPNQPN